MDIESEIAELKRRVGDLEVAVNALAEQVGRAAPQIAAAHQLAAGRFDAIDRAMAGFGERLDVMNTQVWSLRDDLPGMLCEALGRSARET